MSKPYNQRVVPSSETPYRKTPKLLKRGDGKFTSKKKDDYEVKFCEKCNKCWQIEKFASRLTLDYYEDFPTLGLERQQCPKCKTGLNE